MTSARSSSCCPTRSACRRWSSRSTTSAAAGAHREHRARTVLRARLTALATTGRRCSSTTIPATVLVVRGTVTNVHGRPLTRNARRLAERQLGLLRLASSQEEQQRGQPARGVPHLGRTAPTSCAPCARRRTRSRPTDPSGRGVARSVGRQQMRPGHVHLMVSAPGHRKADHPRLRRRQLPTSTTMPCSASATASCARSNPTKPASWPRRSTSPSCRATNPLNQRVEYRRVRRR